MAAQRSTTLPALTIAHQQFLERLITSLEDSSTSPSNIAFLRQLAVEMRRFRAALPGEVRGELDEIDRSMTSFSTALEGLKAGIGAFQHNEAASEATAVWLLDGEYVVGVAQQAHELSQLAAEAALRAKHLADQLSFLNA